MVSAIGVDNTNANIGNDNSIKTRMLAKNKVKRLRDHELDETST